MSTVFKRPDSKYYWYSTRYKGRRLRRSTRMTRRHLARKLQQEWDLQLMLGEFPFGSPAETGIDAYALDYFKYLETRLTHKMYVTAMGMIRRFTGYLEKKNIHTMDQITTRSVNQYLDWLPVAAKTKRNHLGEIKRLLRHAVIEEILFSNPAEHAKCPKGRRRNLHRDLEPEDLELIFANSGIWHLYYRFLYHTGLRAGDVAMLRYENIDKKRKTIVSLVRKSRKVHEFPLPEVLEQLIDWEQDGKTPLFPKLYSKSEQRLNGRLKYPRKHMQDILSSNGRPHATLHSFRRAFNNALRDLGLEIEDRRALLAHASSDTTLVYTNRNLELARNYVDQIPAVVEK